MKDAVSEQLTPRLRLRLCRGILVRSITVTSRSLVHATPLLPAPTLSEGEHRVRVSEGELKVSRRVELPPQFTRSSLEIPTGLPRYLVAFYRLLVRRHGEATGFLLRVHGPYRYLRDGYPYFGLPAALDFTCRVLSLRASSPFVRRATSCEPPPAWQERRSLGTS
jgi:hypothetical protein